MKTNSSLQALFEPKSIAVIGASSKKGKTSYFLMKNLLHGGYPGKVYPVNPNAAKIFTYKSYKSVLDIADEIDPRRTGPQEKLIAQVRAEMVVADFHLVHSAPIRERQPHAIIGGDQLTALI